VVLSDNKSLAFDPRTPASRQQVEELPPYPDGVTPMSWSPDGRRIAGQANRRPGGIVIYTVASRTYEELTRSGTSPAWLPDGRRLLYAAGGALNGLQTWRELLLLDTATRSSTRVYSSPGEMFGGAGLSPDGREIYVNVFRQQSDIVLAKLPASVP